MVNYNNYGVSDAFLEQFAYPELKPLEQDWRWCHKYCYDILKGNIPSCKKMQWAALRHFRDLQNDEFYFDEDAAKSIVLWFKFCPIVKGSKSGTPMILDPSQIFLSVSLMAWKWSEDLYELDEDTGIEMQVRHAHKRRFNQVYAQVSRKYGKTSWVAGIKLYLMYKYEYGPRVFSLATKKDQAKEVWNVAKKMIKLSPRLSAIFEPRANDILYPQKDGEFKALASDSNSLDGLDPMAACLDECHAIKDRNLYGVLISAFGSNEGGEFLFSVITTAGFILNGLCTDLYKNGASVLNPDNDTIQDNYFYAIFEIDKGDDWTDQRAWFKANPGLIYGRPSIKYMRDRLQEATMSVEEKGNFLTKHCNMFVSGSDKWLDMDEVRANYREKLTIEQIGDQDCVLGVDRAQFHDITSFSLVVPTDDGGVDTYIRNLLPQSAFNAAGDYLKEIYRKAIANGDLELVQTASIRDEHVEEIIRWFYNNFSGLTTTYYDPYKMRVPCENLEDEGYDMVAVSQSIGNLSEAQKRTEALIKEELLRYNSVLFEYACECAMMTLSRKDNADVWRENSKVDKIDPLKATIFALAGVTLHRQDYNPYEHRGLITL